MTGALHALLPVLAALAPGAPEYRLAEWPEPGHGNHRAIVHVAAEAEAVRVLLEWRRRDPHPESKAIVVEALATGRAVANAVAVRVEKETGEVAFEPAAGPGDYALYWLPYNPGGGNFDDAGTYFPPADTSDPAWRARNGLDAAGLASGAWRSLPQASVTAFEARGEFHRMDPMELPATEAETRGLLDRWPDAAYLVFPEDRARPIRMFEAIPVSWAEQGPSPRFDGAAQPDEQYAFQLGIWAPRQSVRRVRVRWSPLTPEGGGDAIPASAITCYNTEGRDWLGRPMTPDFSVGEGRVRAMWFGVAVPAGASGRYSGWIELAPEGLPPTTVDVTLDVAGEPLPDHGVRDLWRYARLAWLNSDLGIDDEVLPPYTPLEVEGDSVRCLGREVGFGADGAPAAITSWGHELLAAPARFVVETADGVLRLAAVSSTIGKVSPGAFERQWVSEGGGVRLTTAMRVEFDGAIRFESRVEAERPVEVRDIRLELPLNKERAGYLMGFGQRGGTRPERLEWKWNIARCDNQVWVGDPAGGIQLSLLPEREGWTIFDLNQVGLPTSWCNGGAGGAEVVEEGESVAIRAHSGARTLRPEEPLTFGWRLLVTPFREIDPEHWGWRMGWGGPTHGSNILHIHHAGASNPYINYPFLTTELLRREIDDWRNAPPPRGPGGVLHWPAPGALRAERGTLHLGVRVCFDPDAGSAGNAAYNQQLAAIEFDNGDEVGFYWNIDLRGMRAYIRKGAPEVASYPAMVDAPNLGWKEGEEHTVSLSWGEELAVFVDGQKLASQPWTGLIDTSLAGAKLRVSGDGFALDWLRTDADSFAGGEVLPEPVAEAGALCETFDDGSTAGELTGPAEFADGCVRFLAPLEPLTHERGANVYYTVRELTNHVYEMWPLRSLGDEVFTSSGGLIYFGTEARISQTGGGYPWLQEHLVEGYTPMWRQPLPNWDMDAAIGTQGLSRWHNYYVEGMRFLMRETGVDGLYLDGIGYDREIMKRIRKVMLRENPRSRINFHSGNNYDYLDSRVSCANQYMEHLPFLSNLWFGEGYDYDRGPDYWLIEVSGIPFGLTSEMLEYGNGGNAYRGMLYGMGGRQLGCAASLWRFWDDFAIEETQMLGYWDDRCPVRTDDPSVLATAYVKEGKTLIALAHWPSESAPDGASVRLTIDWQALGLAPRRVRIEQPLIGGFQTRAEYGVAEAIPIARAKGALLVVGEG